MACKCESLYLNLYLVLFSVQGSRISMKFKNEFTTNEGMKVLSRGNPDFMNLEVEAMLYNKIQSVAVPSCNWSEVSVDVIRTEEFCRQGSRC